jgi:hypothetical protein
LTDARPVGDLGVSLCPPDIGLPPTTVGEQPLPNRFHLRRLGKRHVLVTGAVPKSLLVG